MRNAAPSLLLVAWTAIITPATWADDSQAPLGKTPEQRVAVPQENRTYGVLQETPNERRRRLGQPLVATFDPPVYGDRIETPNEQRLRLGLPIEAKFPTPDYGELEPTPNDLRRIAANNLADRR